LVDGINELAKSFISCTLPKIEWTHDAHLKVGLWHLLNYSERDALEKLRVRIKRYNVSCGIENTENMGYHETITQFYLLLIKRFLAQIDTSQSIDILADKLIELYGDNRFLYEYYSRDCLFSKLARQEWVEPDLKTLN
jgi:hypothetical protein